jgi:SAM-dependent MidA family methyltransferase
LPTEVSSLGARIAARARRFGPLPWSVFMESALYDPEGGFYTTGGAAGRRGDFVTSPEIGPLFAEVMAKALDGWWAELDHPDPFVVVEAAAGAGTLARDILAARPACARALRYVLVERSAALREAQSAGLPLELPAFVLGPSAPSGADSDDESVRYVPGRGPMVTSLAELPALTIAGVVLANELLDNLAFDLLEYRDGIWQEVRVGAAGDGDELIEVLVPAPPEVADDAHRLVAGARALSEGARVPLQRAASGWLRQALSLVEDGRVVVVDYADTTASLAAQPWPRWLRSYRHHLPGSPLLERPGGQDITCVVATDQLAAIRRPTSDRSQAAWLVDHGIDELVATARRIWHERASLGDLEAMKARSRVDEGGALVDPAGLGAFRVLEWVVDGGW